MAGVLDLLSKKGKGKKEVVNYEALEEEFEVIYWKQLQDLAEFVESCRQALNRRNSLATDLQNFKVMQDAIMKKNKNNPRSK